MLASGTFLSKNMRKSVRKTPSKWPECSALHPSIYANFHRDWKGVLRCEKAYNCKRTAYISFHFSHSSWIALWKKKNFHTVLSFTLSTRSIKIQPLHVTYKWCLRISKKVEHLVLHQLSDVVWWNILWIRLKCVATSRMALCTKLTRQIELPWQHLKSTAQHQVVHLQTIQSSTSKVYSDSLHKALLYDVVSPPTHHLVYRPPKD